MGIADIKEKLIKASVSDDTIEQFKTALKRVPRTLRCQHCYTTAVAMKPRYRQQAVDLIQYGLQFCDNRLDKMRAHHNLAIIYENNGDYPRALSSYKTAMESTPSGEKEYVYEYSAHLMRVEMHINSFEYTDALECYYNEAVKADEFSRSFMKTAFYEAVAEIIINKKYSKGTDMKKSYKKATEMLSPSCVGPLTALLKRKRYIETVGASKETLAFLKKSKKLVSPT